MCVAVGGVADHFSVDLRAAFERLLALFEDQNSGTFADNETVAVFIERPARLFGFLVSCGERLHGRESTHTERCNRGFSPAGDDRILHASTNEMKGLADGMCTGRACRRRRPIDAFSAKANSDVSRRQV